MLKSYPQKFSLILTNNNTETDYISIKNIYPTCSEGKISDIAFSSEQEYFTPNKQECYREFCAPIY